MEKKYIISIDMGGTKILAGVINSKEGIIAKIKSPTSPEGSQKEYIDSLVKIINALIRDAGLKPKNIQAVCLGIPGSLNPYTGIVGLAPNLGLKNFHVSEKLQTKIPIPVIIENDVNMGALGLKKFGVAKNAKNMLAVFVGTGIGGAIIIDGKIYRGTSFAAGEIGHMIIKKGGPVCGCGKRGCFEAVASRSSIVKSILADIKANKKSIIKKLSAPNKPIKSRILSEAVKAKDKLTIKHISSACEAIGQVLANVTNLMNFDTIVLGGGLIEALDKFMLPKIKKSFNEFALKGAAESVKIVSNNLGDDAALYGGIPLVEEFLKIKI